MTNDERDKIFKDIATLSASIARREKRMAPLHTNRNLLREQLKKGCDRTCGNVVHRSDYSNGSYYDSAYTTHWESCSVCGYYKELPTENHGWYS